MSIKRAKEVSRTAKGTADEDRPMTPKPARRVWDWEKDVAGREADAFIPYATTGTFTEESYIAHSKFGKGVVTAVDGSKIEVLFEEGAKKLSHVP